MQPGGPDAAFRGRQAGSPSGGGRLAALPAAANAIDPRGRLPPSRSRHGDSNLRFFLLLLCFFLSGFAALLYETAWAREFESVFGTSELAVVSVLAAYMAGLAAGAAAAARLVSRVRRPVLWYGLFELGIAASALAVPWAIRGATWLQSAAMGGRSAPPDAESVSAALFYVACAFAILLVPTALMGATLPLLARHAVRREEEIGRRVGTLYAVNTAGAVAGAVATAFLLLPELGLRSTVYAGVATNALVFAAAALLASRIGVQPEAVGAAAMRRPPFHWVLPLVALSGFVSFSYEVLWTRLLGHVVGGTIQGFGTMLASFLLGIAIGSAVAASLARDRARAARRFAAAQIGAAALSLVAFAQVDRLPQLASALGGGSAGAFATNGLLAILMLLPAALCIGAVFPFAVRVLAREEAEAAPASARVYAWNTLGSIAGALASGFVLLPALRFAGTLGLAAGLNLSLALVAACLARPPAKLVGGLAAAGLALLAIARPATPWAVLRQGAMLRSRVSWQGEVEYYGVGRSSTVLLLEQRSGWRLTTNGLPESLVDPAGPAAPGLEPAHWLALLPVLLRPDLRSMLVVGLGGGLTVEAVPSTVERVWVIELEREVVRAHDRLATLRGTSPLADPRVRVVVNDARGALELTDARFGAIVSQPSHPWTAGASHLYTREFFSLAAEHLEPGGVFVQWIGLAFVDEALLRGLVATLLEAFPHVALFQPGEGAVLFAASDAPLDPVATAARALAAAPGDFARFGLRRPEDVAAAWTLDLAGARGLAEGASLLSDDRNALATRAARLRRGGLAPRAADRLLSPYEPLSPTAADLDRIYLLRRLVARGAGPRAVRLAEAAPDPIQRMTLLGWARSVHDPHRAAAEFRKALAADPASQAARFGLLRLRRRAVEADEPQTRELASPLQGAAAAVVSGWRHAARGDWSAVQALEPALATADPRDPSQPDALRLRIQWRAESEDAALRAEAAAMASEMMQTSRLPDDMVLAAQAFAAAQRPDEALRLLAQLSSWRRGRKSQRAGLVLLDRLRPEVDADEWAAVRIRLLGRAPSADRALGSQ
jgi:spermidine synthase